MQILKTKRGQAVVGVFVGALTIGGVAFASTFTFGYFGGNTGFTDATASLSIVGVEASGGRGGVTCADLKKTGDQTFEVSPKAQRLVLQGQNTVTPGDCVVFINVKNTGDVPVTPGIKATQVPEGWTFEKDPKSASGAIAGGATGRVVLRATATEKATGGGIAGELTGETADTPAGKSDTPADAPTEKS